jgi:exodeoxyribonuclease-3
MGKGFMDFFTGGDWNAVCVQETKMQRSQAAFDFGGHVEHWNSAEKKGYSGTAIFSKEAPLAASYGLGNPEHDLEGRVITLEYPAFFLVTCYTPNSKAALERLPYRMVWDDAFREHLKKLDQVKPVVACGDLNVAHKEIDLKNPKTNTQSAGFTPEERAKMTLLLESGFADTFRVLHPDQAEAYTWWSYIGAARKRNTGWRIDYFLVSDRIKDKVLAASIHSDVYGSDHCPVSLELDL